MPSLRAWRPVIKHRGVFRMRAISTLSLECGTSTFWCRALMALRTRVKKSETGSVRLMLYISSNRRSLAFARTVRASASSTLGKEPAATDYLTTLHQLLATALPTRLHDPGNLALQGQTAEAQTADTELAQKGARTSADMTAIVLPDRKFGLLVRLGNTGCLRHCFLYALRLSLFALRELLPTDNWQLATA